MKKIILLFSITTMLFSCGSSDQTKTVNDVKQAQTVIEAMQSGHIPAKEGGWTMTAKMNGKEWVASSFMSPEVADRIIGYYKEESISFPYDRSDMAVGKKIKFGETHAVDLFTNDDVAIWGGRKGEMEITKVDNGWVEGKFFFTATAGSTDKTIEVTDGFFRISIAKN